MVAFSNIRRGSVIVACLEFGGFLGMLPQPPPGPQIVQLYFLSCPFMACDVPHMKSRQEIIVQNFGAKYAPPN
jgi:hypothetical protein